MADLEHMLLEAAGRTGSSSRKNLSRSQARRKHSGSYSDDGSDSKDDDSDNQGHTRKHSGSAVQHKRRFDPTEKDGRASRGGDHDDDDNGDGYRSHSGDSDSELSIGSDLYKDDADREKLSKMSELQREMILTERSIKRDDYWLKKKARASSKGDTSTRKETPPPFPRSGRLSAKSDKSAAKDDALNELRAKRLRQHDPIGDRRSKETSGGGGGRGTDNSHDPSPAKRRTPSMGASSSDSSSSESEDRRPVRGKGSAGENDLIDSDEDGSTSGIDKVTFDEIKDITIRRSKLAKWFMEPFFEELIVGCFVRVGIGKKAGKNIYRLCMVKNVDATDPSRQYRFESKTTHKYLNCVWGSESTAARWQMARISDAHPLEEEYKLLEKEVERNGGRMPERDEVLEKTEAIQKINSFVYSAATVKQMLQEKKSASSRPLNVAAEKNRLRKEMEAAESRGDGREMERIRTKLKELESKSRQVKPKDAKAVKLEEMNRKNRAENFKNASEMKPVNTSLKAGEAGYDPFSRRWTRSRNYYVSKPGDDGVPAANGEGGGGLEEGDMPVLQGAEAGVVATAAAQEAAAGAGKLVDTSAPVDQGTISNMFHNFELPISLAGLQKFGGAQGAPAGFMARKQKLEATFGYRVPENDGRRHALTLTVSDYKRRRGLL